MRKKFKKMAARASPQYHSAVTACQGADVASGEARRLILHRQQEIFWEILRNQKHPERAVISQEKQFLAHRKRAEARTFLLSDIPEYSGSPYVAVNGNVPVFSESDLMDVSFESQQ